MLARPAELSAIIVTVGPTLNEVIPTAPLSESSPYSATISEYNALLATEMALIILLYYKGII